MFPKVPCLALGRPCHDLGLRSLLRKNMFKSSTVVHRNESEGFWIAEVFVCLSVRQVQP